MHAVIDNYSRRILGWRVEQRLNPLNTLEVLSETASKIEGPNVADVIVDAGVENLIRTVDSLFGSGQLRRVLAQVDVTFSNSLIEAWWRSLKHQWLYLHQLDNITTERESLGARCGCRQFFGRKARAGSLPVDRLSPSNAARRLKMSQLQITIERYVDDHQPGFVEFSFLDSDGVARRFIEKVPVITRERLSNDSSYPRPASLACTVVSRTEASGSSVVTIDLAKPYGIEDAVGNSIFTVASGLIFE